MAEPSAGGAAGGGGSPGMAAGFKVDDRSLKSLATTFKDLTKRVAEFNVALKGLTSGAGAIDKVAIAVRKLGGAAQGGGSAGGMLSAGSFSVPPQRQPGGTPGSIPDQSGWAARGGTALLTRPTTTPGTFSSTRPPTTAGGGQPPGGGAQPPGGSEQQQGSWFSRHPTLTAAGAGVTAAGGYLASHFSNILQGDQMFNLTARGQVGNASTDTIRRSLFGEGGKGGLPFYAGTQDLLSGVSALQPYAGSYGTQRYSSTMRDASAAGALIPGQGAAGSMQATAGLYSPRASAQLRMMGVSGGSLGFGGNKKNLQQVSKSLEKTIFRGGLTDSRQVTEGMQPGMPLAQSLSFLPQDTQDYVSQYMLADVKTQGHADQAIKGAQKGASKEDKAWAKKANMGDNLTGKLAQLQRSQSQTEQQTGAEARGHLEDAFGKLSGLTDQLSTAFSKLVGIIGPAGMVAGGPVGAALSSPIGNLASNYLMFKGAGALFKKGGGGAAAAGGGLLTKLTSFLKGGKGPAAGAGAAGAGEAAAESGLLSKLKALFSGGAGAGAAGAAGAGEAGIFSRLASKMPGAAMLAGAGGVGELFKKIPGMGKAGATGGAFLEKLLMGAGVKGGKDSITAALTKAGPALTGALKKAGVSDSVLKKLTKTGGIGGFLGGIVIDQVLGKAQQALQHKFGHGDDGKSWHWQDAAKGFWEAGQGAASGAKIAGPFGAVFGAGLGSVKAIGSYFSDKEHYSEKALGGIIPGHSPTKTADDVPIMATSGEHMWSVDEVKGAGGHGNVARMRKLAAAGKLRGFYDGGAIQHLSVGGKVQGLKPEFLKHLNAWSAAVKKNVTVNSGFRDDKKQTELWNKSDKSGHMVARPGHSPHRTGLAADIGPSDIQQFSAAGKQAKNYGLVWRMPWEKWHIEDISYKGDAAKQGSTGDTTAAATGTAAAATPATPAAAAASSGGGGGGGGSGRNEAEALQGALSGGGGGGGGGASAAAPAAAAATPATTPTDSSTSNVATAPLNGPGPKGISAADWALAKKYGAANGVDPYLLVAIGFAETNWGKVGDGRKGNILGYGSFNSGSSYKWAGVENQLKYGAAKLKKDHVPTINDVDKYTKHTGGITWATDPGWAKNVKAMYKKVTGKALGGPIDGFAEGGEIDPRILAELVKGYASGGSVWGAPGSNIVSASAAGKTFQVNAAAKDRFQKFVTALAKIYKITEPIYGFSNRNIAGSSSKSDHSWGLAIDINATKNGVGSGKGNMPAGVGTLAAKFGLTWGGEWHGKTDPMHFEVSNAPSASKNAAKAHGLPGPGSGTTGATAGTAGAAAATPAAAAATPAAAASPSSGGRGGSGSGQSEVDALQGALSGGGGGGGGGGGAAAPAAAAASATPAATTSGAPGAMPSGNVASWIKTALGILKKDYKTFAPGLAKMIQAESGGDPHSQNNTDSNARKGTPSKGVMQTIDSTFKTYALPGHTDIWNPVDNIIAGFRYAEKTYGDAMIQAGGRHGAGGKYKGYDKGSWEIVRDEIAQLHKGEMVVPAKTAEKVRELTAPTTGKANAGGSPVTVSVSAPITVMSRMNEAEIDRWMKVIERKLASSAVLSAVAGGR